MKNKAIPIFCLLSLLLVASHIFLCMQIQRYKDSLREYAVQLDEYKNYFDHQIEGMGTSIQSLNDMQIQNSSEIQNALVLISNKLDTQFSQTVSMSKTYDNLLDEQRKKTVDITTQDSAIAQIKKIAEQYYTEKNYALACKEFYKVLSYQNDDMSSRLMKMKCLYYKNRADSSKYNEILEDIRIVKANGYYDSEAAEIEKNIIAEIEGINE